MCHITGIGIPSSIWNIGLSTVIYGLLLRAHLPPEEQHNPDQERATHDQWRSQRGQIREHAGLQRCSGPCRCLLLWALGRRALRGRASPPAAARAGRDGRADPGRAGYLHLAALLRRGARRGRI